MTGHSDPGLQPERTSLAWSRTIVSLLLVSAILLRWAFYYGAWLLPIVTLLMTVGIVLQLTQRSRYRHRVAGLARNRVAPSVLGILCLSATAIATGIVGLVLVIIEYILIE